MIRTILGRFRRNGLAVIMDYVPDPFGVTKINQKAEETV